MPYLILVILVTGALIGLTDLFAQGKRFEFYGMDIALRIGAFAAIFMFIGGRFRNITLLIFAPVIFLLLATIGLSAFLSVPSAATVSGFALLYYIYGSDKPTKNLTYLFGMVAVWCSLATSGPLYWWSAMWVIVFFIATEGLRLFYLKYQEGYTSSGNAFLSILKDYCGYTKEVCPNDSYLDRYIENDKTKNY